MFELTFRITADVWEKTESVLYDSDAVAITQSHGKEVTYADVNGAAADFWSKYKISALFETRTAAETAGQRLMPHRLISKAAKVEFIQPESWSESWRSAWKPLFFPGELCVYPSWVEPSVVGKKVVFVDPGMAFGTGTHETTSLCLDWIGSTKLDGKTFLDYGCGSGILALAAAAMGARRICAFDTDPLARTVALENVGKNGFTDVVEVPATPPPHFVADILFANILLAPLIGLRRRFFKYLRPGASLLLAGILKTQVEALRFAYEPIHLDVIASKGEWVLLHGEAPQIS